MQKKPNYDFEKRRKEIARKQKQEEKRARKNEGTVPPEQPSGSTAPDAPSEPTAE